jgi:putative PIN family toxin of toxin-antitoxin system
MRVVVDTNIMVGAMLQQGGACRAIIRLCLLGELVPLIGVALFSEMEDVLSRPKLFSVSPLYADERSELFAAFLSTSQWVQIYYSWRPNLRDEADNHIVDLAVAGGADYIITQNIRDFDKMELKFPQLKHKTAAEFLGIWRKE